MAGGISGMRGFHGVAAVGLPAPLCYTRLRNRGFASSSSPTAVRKSPVKSTAMMIGGTYAMC
jgi:hypothetical protein